MLRVIFLLECDICFDLHDRLETCISDDYYAWANTACNSLFIADADGWLVVSNTHSLICPSCVAKPITLAHLRRAT